MISIFTYEYKRQSRNGHIKILEFAMKSDDNDEISRLRLRIDILERDLVTSQRENQLLSTNPLQPVDNRELEEKYQRLLQEFLQKSTDFEKLAHKSCLIQRFLQREQISLDGFKLEAQGQMREMSSSFQASMTKILQYLTTIEDTYNEKLRIESKRCERLERDLKCDMERLIEEKQLIERQLQDASSRASFAEAEHRKQLIFLNENISSSEDKVSELRAKFIVKENEWKATLASQQSIADKLKNELKTLHENDSLREKNLSQLLSKISFLEASNKDLDTALSQGTRDRQRLLDDNNNLFQENERLKKDLWSSGSDKTDVQERLKSIQGKLRAIEVNHVQELERNKEVLTRTETYLEEKRNECTKQQGLIAAMEASIRQLNDVIKSRDVDKKALDELLEKSKLESQTVSKQYKEQINNLRVDIDNLRHDRDDLMQQKEDILAKFRSIQDNESETNRAEIVAKDEEIRALKETIRRECEERTMMKIQLANLRDELLRCKTVAPVLNPQTSLQGNEIDDNLQEGDEVNNRYRNFWKKKSTNRSAAKLASSQTTSLPKL